MEGGYERVPEAMSSKCQGKSGGRIGAYSRDREGVEMTVGGVAVSLKLIGPGGDNNEVV